MARGTESKAIIVEKILQTFPGSFSYDKEIRIPMQENGETVQIKVTLTAAKTNVEVNSTSAAEKTINVENKPITQEEKNQVVDLIARLGL